MRGNPGVPCPFHAPRASSHDGNGPSPCDHENCPCCACLCCCSLMHAALGILPQETARAVFAPLLATIAAPPAFLGSRARFAAFAWQPRAPLNPDLIDVQFPGAAIRHGRRPSLPFRSRIHHVQRGIHRMRRCTYRRGHSRQHRSGTLCPAGSGRRQSRNHSRACRRRQAGEKTTYKLEYEVQASVKADHVHLYVDGDEVGMVHKLKGSFKLGPMKAGDRKVCVSPVNKNHTPIGAQACIPVTVQ